MKISLYDIGGLKIYQTGSDAVHSIDINILIHETNFVNNGNSLLPNIVDGRCGLLLHEIFELGMSLFPVKIFFQLSVYICMQLIGDEIFVTLIELSVNDGGVSLMLAGDPHQSTLLILSSHFTNNYGYGALSV